MTLQYLHPAVAHASCVGPSATPQHEQCDAFGWSSAVSRPWVSWSINLKLPSLVASQALLYRGLAERDSIPRTDDVVPLQPAHDSTSKHHFLTINRFKALTHHLSCSATNTGA
jgi:hypothetical protein